MRVEPWDDNTAEVTPLEFEKLVKNYFEKMGKRLDEFKVDHNEKMHASDGSYQIDVTARFEALGGDFLVLVECKHHKNPIKRDVVQLLAGKVRSLGAQKGMIFATVGFQRGAIEYAKKHGIALVRIIDGKLTYDVKSNIIVPAEPPPWVKLPKYVAIYIEQLDEKTILTSDISERDIEPLENFLFN